jgi:hypothetical protein
MTETLDSLFHALVLPHVIDADRPLYSAVPIPGHDTSYVAKDQHSLACLLLSTDEASGRRQAPIRLETVQIQFGLLCRLTTDGLETGEGRFTVIQCRSAETATIRYFYSVCETLLRVLGKKPTQHEVASAVNHLAAILQKMEKPQSRPVNGLFGELLAIRRSASPVKAVGAWRVEETARFDFSSSDVRLEVKATTGRARSHSFSFDQCNPPPGTHAVVASIFVERSPGGLGLGSLVEEVESQIAAHGDLVFKLHDVVASTLGAGVGESLRTAFDIELAESSLRFFDLRDIPAIRGALPAGVDDVHFRSDLSALKPVLISTLLNESPAFHDLLPNRHS